MRIGMCSIQVTDPAHAYRFYTEVLGFDSSITIPEHDVYVVTAPGQDVGLLLEPADEALTTHRAALTRAGIPVIVFATDTLDDDIERLRGDGVRILGEVFTDASGRAINFDDSVGNIIQLHEAAQ